MKILWINTGKGKTMSNTRLYGIPPALAKWGDENIVLIAGRSRTDDLPSYFLPLPVPLGRLGAYRLLVALLLPYLCWRYRPDILLSDWTSARLTRLVVILRKLGLFQVKLVHDVRTVPVKEDGGKSMRIYAGSLRYVKRHFDGLTAITEPLRDEICRDFEIASEQIGVWTSGVDVEHFKPQNAGDLRRRLGLEGKFVVFYHGSVETNRRIHELALATALLEDMPDLRLLIVGGGNEWDLLQKVVKENDLRKVILQPSVPYGEIPAWIACADLCAIPLPDHPWWRVSSPLKIMEYLAMGKPVLLTDIIAHRAIIPLEEDAFYVPRCSAKGFAQGLRHAIASRERFAELGRKGRNRAIAELTWEGQARILKNYLQEVWNGKIKL